MIVTLVSLKKENFSKSGGLYCIHAYRTMRFTIFIAEKTTNTQYMQFG